MRDNDMIFSAAQSVLSTAESTYSKNILSQSTSSGGTVGVPQPFDNPHAWFWECTVNYGASGGSTASTITFALQDFTSNAFTTPIVRLTTAAVLKAALTTGAILIKAPLPYVLRQHLRCYYTVSSAGVALTAFKVNSWLDTF
jgi:hypothetical protein